MRILKLDENTKKNLLEDLLKRSPNQYTEYEAYAKQNLCISMLYLKSKNEIEMINLVNGKKKIVTSKIK